MHKKRTIRMSINIETIIFDFDGVVIDSVKIKRDALAFIFEDFSPNLVEQILEYHDQHRGISRYEKIAHFFNDILKQPVSDKEMLAYAHSFADYTLARQQENNVLIADTCNFIKENYKHYQCHIASGAPQEELDMLLDHHNLKSYFKSVHGTSIKNPSTFNKASLVDKIVKSHSLNPENAILIGDSIDDHNACLPLHINFFGYNNPFLKEFAFFYLEDFTFLNPEFPLEDRPF